MTSDVSYGIITSDVGIPKTPATPAHNFGLFPRRSFSTKSSVAVYQVCGLQDCLSCLRFRAEIVLQIRLIMSRECIASNLLLHPGRETKS